MKENIIDGYVRAKMTFMEWMGKVDNIVWEKMGCSVRDLPDCMFLDWYDDGVIPAYAARWAIEAANA